MKKILLSVLITITMFGFSQTLKIDTGGVDVDGLTLDYIFTDTTSSGHIKGDVYVEITNTATDAADSIEFQVRRTNQSITCGEYYYYIYANDTFVSGHQMCLGIICYPGDTIPGATNTKRLHAGETIELHIQLEFFPNGQTTEFYEIYEYGNESNNLVSFTANYDAGCPTSVNNISNTSIIKTYPNPANTIINFSYNVNNNNSHITIHDITGKQVGNIELNSNKTLSTYNTEKLQSGIYFYNVYVNGVKTKTDKFIVRH